MLTLIVEIIFFTFAGLFFLGFFVPLSAVIAGVAAIVIAILRLAGAAPGLQNRI